MPTDRIPRHLAAGAAVTPESGPVPDAMDERLARAIFQDAVTRYAAACRARVPGFVDRHFSLGGALDLHRHALGWDLARAPANLMLAVPALSIKLAAALSRRFGASRLARWLDGRRLFLKTDVGREIEWLVQTELLELPCVQRGRISTRDALAAEILADPRLADVLSGALAVVARHSADPVFRSSLIDALTAYAGTRHAAAEIATSLIGVGIGAAAFKQVTPGMVSLGPVVAAAVAQKAAIAGFPLGAWLGGLWYGLVPASAGIGLVIGVTGGLMALAALLAAFAGILADPIQRRLGLHRRRLRRMVAVLERTLLSNDPGRFVVRDHYVARLLDFFDLLRTAQRLGS